MRVMEDPQNTVFRDGPDDTHVGRWFAIAMGDYKAPISSLKLSEVLDILFMNIRNNSNENKTILRNILHHHMALLNTVAPV